MDGDESSDDGGRADDVFEDLARERQSAVVGVHGWEGGNNPSKREGERGSS
jgi:hypothetical protein